MWIGCSGASEALIAKKRGHQAGRQAATPHRQDPPARVQRGVGARKRLGRSADPALDPENLPESNTKPGILPFNYILGLSKVRDCRSGLAGFAGYPLEGGLKSEQLFFSQAKDILRHGDVLMSNSSVQICDAHLFYPRASAERFRLLDWFFAVLFVATCTT